jgi:hypothetical protein
VIFVVYAQRGWSSSITPTAVAPHIYGTSPAHIDNMSSLPPVHSNRSIGQRRRRERERQQQERQQGEQFLRTVRTEFHEHRARVRHERQISPTAYRQSSYRHLPHTITTSETDHLPSLCTSVALRYVILTFHTFRNSARTTSYPPLHALNNVTPLNHRRVTNNTTSY